MLIRRMIWRSDDQSVVMYISLAFSIFTLNRVFSVDCYTKHKTSNTAVIKEIMNKLPEEGLFYFVHSNQLDVSLHISERNPRV